MGSSVRKKSADDCRLSYFAKTHGTRSQNMDRSIWRHDKWSNASRCLFGTGGTHWLCKHQPLHQRLRFRAAPSCHGYPARGFCRVVLSSWRQTALSGKCWTTVDLITRSEAAPRSFCAHVGSRSAWKTSRLHDVASCLSLLLYMMAETVRSHNPVIDTICNQPDYPHTIGSSECGHMLVHVIFFALSLMVEAVSSSSYRLQHSSGNPDYSRTLKG